jgi:hypothetical protein
LQCLGDDVADSLTAPQSFRDHRQALRLDSERRRSRADDIAVYLDQFWWV